MKEKSILWILSLNKYYLSFTSSLRGILKTSCRQLHLPRRLSALSLTLITLSWQPDKGFGEENSSWTVKKMSGIIFFSFSSLSAILESWSPWSVATFKLSWLSASSFFTRFKGTFDSGQSYNGSLGLFFSEWLDVFCSELKSSNQVTFGSEK